MKNQNEMSSMKITKEMREEIKILQIEELNGMKTYLKLADMVKDSENKKVLKRIAVEEKKHYDIWKTYTDEDIKPNKLKIQFFYFLSRIFGLTFGIRLMELGEADAQKAYEKIIKQIPEAEEVMKEEETHEELLIDMLDEESLNYAGSVVLGLNDALVELTGALAGLTFAFQNTRVIALAGLITGISASFSMAASEYLSKKSEEDDQDPMRSAVYTGIAYIFTVFLLVAPFLLTSNYYLSLAWTIVNAIIVIAGFNYYISVAKGYNFRRRFLEMASISLGVAFFSFILGNLIRIWLGVDI
jgi:VIT1/CCC1 family predicted Fe2+/Mn2+ transporter